MSTQTVRVNKRTHDELLELSKQRGESMQALIELAVEELRRKRFFEQTDEAYLTLRTHPSEWSALIGERSEWEGTLADGLENAD